MVIEYTNSLISTWHLNGTLFHILTSLCISCLVMTFTVYMTECSIQSINTVLSYWIQIGTASTIVSGKQVWMLKRFKNMGIDHPLASHVIIFASIRIKLKYINLKASHKYVRIGNVPQWLGNANGSSAYNITLLNARFSPFKLLWILSIFAYDLSICMYIDLYYR